MEILGMIEEAAGTRMYEDKKKSALRTIEKKQHKLDEIDKVFFILLYKKKEREREKVWIL